MPGEISAGRPQAAWGLLSERQSRCIFNCNRSRDTTASPVAKPADHPALEGVVNLRLCSIEHVAQAKAGAGEAAVAFAETCIGHVRHRTVETPALGYSKPQGRGFAEIQRTAKCAAGGVIRAIVQRAAECQLERQPLQQRDIPRKAGIALARIAIDVDRRADVKARPQGNIGQAAAVGDGRPTEKHLEVDIQSPPLGPGRLDVMSQNSNTDFVDDASWLRLAAQLGRRATRGNQRRQKSETEHAPRSSDLERHGHELRRTPMRPRPPHTRQAAQSALR